MEFLPKDLLVDLRAAELKAARRRSRLRIHTGEHVLPVLRRWKEGFALDASQIRQLRGHVELYEGARQLSILLIVASEIEGDELICTVKRETAVTEHAALDFVRDETAPRALLPRPGRFA